MHQFDRFLIGGRIFLQNITPSPAIWYGLEFSDVLEETIPLFTKPMTDPALVHLAKRQTTRHQV